MLAKQEMTAGILAPAFGVFLLACGSCALNQYQERRPDKLMDRTRNRPLPSGKLRHGICLLISMSSMLTGVTILAYGPGLIALGLGIFAVLWYNGIYTFLKQKTAFATIPGALIGAIPLPWVGFQRGKALATSDMGGRLLLLHLAGAPFLASSSQFWQGLRKRGISIPDTGIHFSADQTDDFRLGFCDGIDLSHPATFWRCEIPGDYLELVCRRSLVGFENLRNSQGNDRGSRFRSISRSSTSMSLWSCFCLPLTNYFIKE